MRRLLVAAFFLAAAPAWAQRSEVSLVAGYTTSGGIENKALQFQDIALAGSFTFGAEAGHFFTPHAGIEISWARQESALTLTTSAGDVSLFDVHVDQVQASFAYQFGAESAHLRPFVSAGLGAAIFSADEPDTETKLAPTLGAGLKWWPGGRVGARVEARYNPTRLNDADSDFCDPFGFCQSWLQQFELTGGVSLRF